MLQTVTRVSPQAARYTPAGSPIEHCSLCRFYVARGSNCLRIMGRVSLDGWCKYFSREMVQPWQDPGGTQAGHGGGPTDTSLDLSFTTGVMPGGVTFTRASTATYFNSSGVMQTAATNTPRLDYDPVAHTPRGLLIEEARTNIVTNSGALTDFNAALMNKTQAATTAPDGTTTGVLLTETAAAGEHAASFVFTATASTTYTGTVFVKAGTRTRVAIEFRVGGNWSGGNAVVVANLTAGTVAVFSGTGVPSIQNVGNGWYRISITLASVAAPSGSSQMWLGLADNTGNTNYTGDGTSGAYFWGAQLEAGAFATSYIPTTAAAATRAAEVCSMPLGAWYVQQLGTLQVEALQPALCSKPMRLLGVEQAAAQTAINVAGSNNVAMYDSVGGLNTVVGLEPVGTVFKAAFAYANGAQSIVLNAGTPQTAAVATLGTGMTTMAFGCQIATISLQPNAWIRRARYWPRALSTAELQAVTT